MQYGMAYTMIRGIEDFLAGPDVLRDGGPAALAAIRQERKSYAETVVHPAVQSARSTNAIPRFIPRATAPQGENQPGARQALAVPMARPDHPRPGRHCGLRTTSGGTSHCWTRTVVTDASQSGVRVRRRNKQKHAALTKRMNKALKQFRAEAPALQESYRQALPDLISRENWARL